MPVVDPLADVSENAANNRAIEHGKPRLTLWTARPILGRCVIGRVVPVVFMNGEWSRLSERAADPEQSLGWMTWRQKVSSKEGVVVVPVFTLASLTMEVRCNA